MEQQPEFTAKVVVGAGYGDEGKGLMTDWLVSQELEQGRRPLVVRANGGVQAAHTVQTPEGVRHVFNGHGSGSLLGAPTYLSEYFLVNPIGFRMERESLPQLTDCKVYADYRAKMTLPIDMQLNQMIETVRGGKRHGSCGWGIGETEERSQHPGLRVTVETSRNLGVTELYNITKAWLPQRLAALGVAVEDVPDEFHKLFHDGNILERWLNDAEQFRKSTVPLNPHDLDLVADTLIFEGAQGLGLDAEGGHFPYVTRSRTGSTNPLAMMTALAERPADRHPRMPERVLAHVEMVYVTRAYATRHGAGPLEHEGEAHGCEVDDPTNVPNQWQQSLRSAPLDMDLTVARIVEDLLPVLVKHPQALLSVAMTCLDQAGTDFAYKAKIPHPAGEPCNPDFLLGRVTSAVRSECLLRGRDTQGMRMITSHGPTRDSVSVDHEDDLPYSFHLKKVLAKLRGLSGVTVQ